MQKLQNQPFVAKTLRSTIEARGGSRSWESSLGIEFVVPCSECYFLTGAEKLQRLALYHDDLPEAMRFIESDRGHMLA